MPWLIYDIIGDISTEMQRLRGAREIPCWLRSEVEDISVESESVLETVYLESSGEEDAESLEDMIEQTQLLRQDALAERPEVLQSLRQVFADKTP